MSLPDLLEVSGELVGVRAPKIRANRLQSMPTSVYPANLNQRLVDNHDDALDVEENTHEMTYRETNDF